MIILNFRLERKTNSGGKVVCVSGEVFNDIISDIKICGDFFLFPNDKIVSLENAIKGCKVDYVTLCEKISDSVSDAYVMGFTPEDLSKIICDACKKKI